MQTIKTMEYQYERWLKEDLEDTKLLKELKEIKDNPKEIEDRFYTELTFGTAGLRGILGVGTNRMNIYTVRKVSQGISSYLLKKYTNPQVVIAYDSRINSTLFARESARVYAGNGIKTYIFRELAPTPLLSYAVRKLNCQGGVIITASHNPANYNGYKAYDDTGCQISTEIADEVYLELQNIDYFNDIKLINFHEGFDKKIIEYVPSSLINSYYEYILSLSTTKDFTLKRYNIVYTPLNGTGLIPVSTVLTKAGFKHVAVVSSQKSPDGNFPTCPYPNPETKEAMEQGLRLSKAMNADLLIATDPDCDRVGIAIRHDNEFSLLTGNEVGILLFDYICNLRMKNRNMPENPVVIKSIVSTDLIRPMAKKYGVELIETLTGFKYIGEQMTRLVSEGRENDFLFGFEESYGYLSGTKVRDKDAVNASLLITEMCYYYSIQKQSLIDRLGQIYKEFGYYINNVKSYAFEGKTGHEKMASIIDKLRHIDASTFIGEPITTTDYLTSTITTTSGEIINIDFHKSDVIKYELANGSCIIVRPSGTEPKLKIYFMIRGINENESNSIKIIVEEIFDNFIHSFK